ncbi:hypothetical protein TWF281_011319 [Arthrobotrys megalospora]
MDYITKIKSEPTADPLDPPPSPPPKPPTSTKRKIKSEPPTNSPDSTSLEPPPPPPPTNKRGRKSGTTGSSSFTKEQDAYIIQLRQEGKNNPEVHRLFEDKFATGSNPKRIENRYFAIKDEVLLNEWEDNLLLQAIEEIENDMSGAIIRRFKELSNGKSVTKGYVMKKMKGKRGGTTAAAKSDVKA